MSYKMENSMQHIKIHILPLYDFDALIFDENAA
jgi:hypothetical protein